MKRKALKYSILTLVVLPFLVLTVVAQDFNKISMAIQSGNSRELAKMLDNNIEITILDEEASYSKAQAEMVLESFFDKNKPQSFQIIHKGSSNEGSKYGIGKLVTVNGTYRTYIYAKIKDGSYFIQEIRFEED